MAEVSGGSGAAGKRARHLMSVLLFLLALPALILFPVCQFVPQVSSAAWYSAFRSVNRVEIFSSMIAPFAGYATYMEPGAEQFNARYEALYHHLVMRIMKSAAFPLCILVISICFVRPVILPLSDKTTFNEMWTEDGVLYASATSTGGAASLASAMRVLNSVAVSERVIAQGTYTDGDGADFWNIARHAVSRGYRCRFYAPATADDIVAPSVIKLTDADRSSYISVLRRGEGGVLFIADPSEGLLQMLPDAYDAKYGAPPAALAIENKR